MEILRTFIGVPVSVGRKFLQARQELMHALEGERISWTAPGQYHITVKFLGDTRDSIIAGISGSLREKVTLPEPARVMLDQPGSFGSHGKPKVIWIGFEQHGLFESLKREVEGAISDFGFPTDDHPFRAHLTVGRIRSLDDPVRYYRIIAAMKDRFREEVRMDRLIFYQSLPAKGGPVYTPLEEIAFRVNP
jgi:2'-5' RNA ligase